MKKNYLLSILFSLLGTISGWAEFNPTAGKGYVLKEKTSGLYLDIQTLGIHEPNHTTNSMSLNDKQSIIFFEAGAEGKWRLKNANGTYGSNITSGRHWNTTISDTSYDWIIIEDAETGITIAKDDNNYIGWDNGKEITAGSALYNNAEGGNTSATRIYFILEDYIAKKDITGIGKEGTINIADIHTHGLANIHESTGWTISMDVENPNGTSYNEWGTSIFAIGSNAFPEKNGYKGLQFYLQSSTNGGKLNAVFDGKDHQIANVTCTGNFSAVISYNGKYQLQIKTTNASGTVGVNDFTLNNKLAEFSQLAYGLPEGINIKNLQIAPLANSIDYETAATISDGKYDFTSGKILYAGQCNKIRFTLTETDAKYKNGAKRMSFDSFKLYDAKGKEVELKENYFAGNHNKSYAGMLDGINAGKDGAGCCCGVWSSTDTGDDYFEIALPNDIDLGGAFSFSFVTENTTMNAKAFNITMSYEAPVDYTFGISGNGENNVEVTYNGETLAVGSTINIADFDPELVSATEIPGYTWSVVVDNDAATITVVYTKAAIVQNPEAVVALVKRIGGDGVDKKFLFVLDPSMNSKNEVFSIGAEDGKIAIKGSTISAITTGLGWYLNNIAKINIAWNSLNEKTVSGDAYADLSNIPVPTTEETHTCDAKYRYYLNYCTFGYSMTSWTWKRWQQEIDWMALHGINMPLQIVGLEEVWRQFLTMEQGGKRKYGYTDEEAKAFVAGPAFTAWWGMNNLEGWGGTKEGSLNGGTWEGAGGVQDDAWYIRQSTLAKSIVDRQRELGMQPVLPGFSGMVPTNFTNKTNVPTDANGGKWAGGFQRPRIIDPTYNGFADIAKDYYDCLKAVMGESQYYSMDPFHEGGSISSGKYNEAYYAIFEAMEAAKAGSQWVIQQWQWDGNQKKSLNAVPAGRLVVLDLFSDGKPAFDGYKGYEPQDAVFCAIPNFGGRSGLMGRLNNLADNYFHYKSKYPSIKGIGAAPEAIEQTPVSYDLIFQLPWMGSKPDMAEWIKQYANARYGKNNEVVQQAWDLLRMGVLNYGADAIQGPVEDVWAARPNLDAKPASAWGKTLNHAGGTYTKARRQMLVDATYKLLGQSDALGLTSGSVYESNYNYDLVELGGGVMADYAYDLLLGIKAAKEAAGANFANDATFKARRDAFLALILDVDAFKGTNLNFRLGKWTQEARDAAREVEGATTATPDWYEYNNARTILTTWSSPNTNLNDYSYRSWQGLMKDVYLPRWEYFFNNGCNGGEYGYFEWNWAHGMEHAVGQTEISTTPLTKGQAGHTDSYTRDPEGNTVEEAKALLGKYIIPVSVNGSTYYAYRGLDNDLASIATIPASAGTTIDLTPYFGQITGISSFECDAVDGQVTDMSKVAIKENITDGAYKATITLEDATKLTFYFSVNPGYYGVYNIYYKDESKDAPVFVGYNEDKDNANNVGYKLIAEGTYKPSAEGDKFFTITPLGSGYTISAQGKYLKAPNLAAWNHLMFSDNSADAGIYLIEDAENGVFKLRNPSTADDIKYVNDYDKLVFGNDKAGKENLATFSISEAKSYPLTITEAGMATLCLPFNVVIPEGMYAYDLASTSIEDSETEGKYVCTMQAIAKPGETLKKGTPVIVKAEKGKGNYSIDITMSNSNAKTSMGGSLLRGNFVKQDLQQGTTTRKYIFADGDSGIGFYPMQAEGGTIAANKCWMEWARQEGMNEARAFVIRFDEETGIDDVILGGKSDDEHLHLIYNIAGQQLIAPQKGLNIINNKKVLVK